MAKRGAALGLVAAGSSLGGVIFPIMVVKLIPEVGFGWAMRICAFLILALLVFANLTVRSRIAPTNRPFEIMAFVRPLKEPTFALLTGAIFFFYCKPLVALKAPTAADPHRGHVHSIHVHRGRSARSWHVQPLGKLSRPNSQRCQVSPPPDLRSSHLC